MNAHPEEPGESLFDQDRRRIYGVAEVTRLIKSTLENEIGAVWIEGEVSNLRRPSSGHLYFTLKDETAQIRAVFFKGHQAGSPVAIKDGLKLRVMGAITVYERSGDYQILVRRVEDAGLGKLQAAFEALKKKLAAEGLFEQTRKRPIPLLPQHIAVITSPTGAAIRDILNVVSRRFANLHVLIAPVKVQGEGAAEQIAKAIDFLNDRGGLDVMIVGRGGGSLEDLWCFNEEVVARAIAHSRIPVISAVGHEIDFTISDFVADLRAPTPSAAAELVVGQKAAFEDHLRQTARQLEKALRLSLLEARNRLQSAAQHPVFSEPRNIVRHLAQRIDHLEMRLAHAIRHLPVLHRQRLTQWTTAMRHAAQSLAHRRQSDIDRLTKQLQALSPLAVLERGFSITQTVDGRVVRTVDQVAPGVLLHTRLADGSVESQVTVLNKKGEPS